jgi:antirestriction protein ArdC
MRNSRMADARKTSRQRRSCGIIRVPALCALCRYRHNAHWTGHPSRLARPFCGAFASADYAREELVAELGSAFVCAALGITGRLTHAEYLGAWLAILRADKRAIFTAASAARHAADFLIGTPATPAHDEAAAEEDGTLAGRALTESEVR